jgi:hypothetical protein
MLVQGNPVTVSSSKVTAPVIAHALPSSVTVVFSVMEAEAMMVPAKSVPVPSVAELPTTQTTSHGTTPGSRITLLFDAVTRVDVASKIQTGFVTPLGSSVRLPMRLAVEAADI